LVVVVWDLFNSHGVSNSEPSTSKQPETGEELSPVDLDDEELAAYAEECAQRAVMADFDDIPEEELFSWSDFEEPDEGSDMDIA
jgi:hypothetical protein